MADDGRTKAMKELLGLTKELQTAYKSNLDIEKQVADLQERRSERQSLINQLQQNYNDLNNRQKGVLNDLIKLQNSEYDTLKKLSKQQKEINEQLQKEIKTREKIVDLANSLASALKQTWTFLQSQDKIIKSSILNLGMSGAKADMMRDSFEQSAGFVARLGGSLEDVQGIMEGFADETGRARVLSADMVKDIEMIGKGTGLGIEGATKLGDQFELIGIDAKSAMDYVQGVVDTSERMGVNTTKVLKNINDNFKRLQGYTFQQGVKGFAQMAEYAEKFKISIDAALNAADIGRTLEGAINMGAQLQVMGGNFAKMNPFDILYNSRNNPEQFQKDIASMTKGIATLRKNTDGTFQKFISPADMDRLTQVGKALGISADEMKAMALRQLDITTMADKLQGMGLTDREKELIQGAAFFDTNTGKFQVMLAGEMRDINTLTRGQAESFVKQTVSLEERAKQAQTFDEVLKITINELKAALLPILKGVNKVLEFVRPVVDGLSKLAGSGWGGVVAAASILLSAGLLWKVVSSSLSKALTNWGEKLGEKGIGGAIGGTLKGKGGASGAGPSFGSGAGPSFGSGAGAGLKGLGKGAGFGVALAGAGAGIMLAAEGISKLADSMSKLTPEQAKSLASIVKSLSWFMAGAALAAVGILLLGEAATAGAVGLLALGATFLMIGAGIGIAAAGIGFMGEGLAKLVESAKGAGPAMLEVGAGIAAISLAMMGFTFGALGFLTFAATMHTIAKNADAMSKVGDAFKQISTVMHGSKDDFIAVQNAVESISKMNTKGGGMLADLATLLKSPLKVEFANGGQVTLKNDVTLDIDGNKFMHKVYNTVVAIEKQQALKQGKAGK